MESARRSSVRMGHERGELADTAVLAARSAESGLEPLEPLEPPRPSRPSTTSAVVDDPVLPEAARRGAKIAEKYVVERVLGVGGMGVVVSAMHVALGQRVAVKVMLS
jgi:serine/threonine protein kinase